MDANRFPAQIDLRDGSTVTVRPMERTDSPAMLAFFKALPDVPIIATGGKTGESILRTIEAGANAITYTPPSTYELFQEMMKGYRE